MDQHGSIQSKVHEIEKPVFIKKINLLFKVGRNSKNEITYSEPIDQVNQFLLSLHIQSELQESCQYSKALINYFTFLLDIQAQWEENAPHLPKPDWDIMPIRKSLRPTYQYRNALKYSVINQNQPQFKLARNTASAYMRCVITFYKFHLRKGKSFQNPPFEHELVNINYSPSSSFMKSYLSKEIHTTDLRLKFGKDKRNNEITKGLVPLTNKEWDAVSKVLHNCRVIKNVRGEYKWHSLPYEFSLLFKIMRFTGLRRIEVSSLHLAQLPIHSPQSNSKLVRLDVGANAGSITKGKENKNPNRTIHIPAHLIQSIRHYCQSKRYIDRLHKYNQIYSDIYKNNKNVDPERNYIFLTNTGKPMFIELASINNRWSEIRKNSSIRIGLPISSPYS